MWGGGSTAPAGYLIADGSAVSRTTYAALFAVYGTTYGTGNGTTTFTLPNLKGVVVAGYDASQAEFNAMGKTGGAKTHTLTAGQMPVHTHVQNAHNHTQNPHRHGVDQSIYSDGGNKVAIGQNPPGVQFPDNAFVNYETATNQAATATNQNAGGGAAHNNLQPYVVLRYIVKT
jgi:microcystin-dependent protein